MFFWPCQNILFSLNIHVLVKTSLKPVLLNDFISKANTYIYSELQQSLPEVVQVLMQQSIFIRD